MLINFSSEIFDFPKVFLTADETEILVQTSKLKEEYEKYGGNTDASISKS